MTKMRSYTILLKKKKHGLTKKNSRWDGRNVISK